MTYDLSFLDRIKSFLEFIRGKIELSPEGAEKISKLRRISDLRIRQWRARKPNFSPAELCVLLAPGEGKTRFDSLSLESGLFVIDELRKDLDPFGEEMTLFRECALLLEDVAPDRLLAALGDHQKALAAEAVSRANQDAEKALKAVEDPEPGLPPRIEKLLGGVKDLWSIPQLTQKLQELLSTPETETAEVARILKQDPGLASQVLRIINSSFYGVSGNIGSVERAVVMLGYRTVKRIVTLSSMIAKLGKAHQELEFDMRSHWGHSLWVAHAASLLMEGEGPEVSDEYFSAGLLHDVGKLVEYQYLRTFMRQILNGARTGTPYEKVEQRVLETDHTEIGACVCEKWGLPEYVGQSVRHHHSSPEEMEDRSISRHAMTVTALCRLNRRQDDREKDGWCDLLNLTHDRFSEIQSRASTLALKSLRDVFIFS